MRSLIAVLLVSVAAAVSASAAEGDVELAVYPRGGPKFLVGLPLGYNLIVTNHGPDEVHNVRVKAALPAQTRTGWITAISRFAPCPDNECRIDVLPKDGVVTFDIDLRFDPVPTSFETTVTVTADESDPNPANNTFTHRGQLVIAPDLGASLFFSATAEAEGPATVTGVVRNTGTVPAHDVVYEVDFPEGTQVVGAHPTGGFTCEASGAHLTCRAPVLAGDYGQAQFLIDLIAPPHYEGGYLHAHVAVSSADEDLDETNNRLDSLWGFYHLLVVRSTADSGEGSFRQAILDVNATCGYDCRLTFRIPESERDAHGWFVIRPESPLPFIHAPVAIVAPPGVQPEGHRVNPQVMLDGSKLAYGNGLSLDILDTYGTIEVSGLAIGNFPNAGISLLGGTHSIRECFIGTMPNGLDPAPNGRGIEGNDSREISIAHNVVSGNKRSGITLAHTYRPQLTRNAIGLGANGVTPVPNGASGVYLADGADWAFFFNNDIAYNVDFGIAMAPGIKRMLASINAIYGNLQQGIDAGIDLETPNVEDDRDRIPNHPVITSARWDEASQQTIVQGEMHSNPTGGITRLKVELYADASEHPQAREFLGTANVSDGRFTLAVDRDVRGKSVTGIGIRWAKIEFFDQLLLSEETSEISAPMRVE